MEYHVFLTPKGDCKGLYVANETPAGFEVHELGGGQSTVAFDYRIVARRKGYESVRLADVPFTVSLPPPLISAVLPDFHVPLPVMVAVAPLRENCPPAVKPPSNLRVLAFPNVSPPVPLMVVAPVTSRLSALPDRF